MGRLLSEPADLRHSTCVLTVTLRAALALVVIPILIALYLSRTDALKAQTWARRWIWNMPFWILFFVVAGALIVEIVTYRRSTPTAEGDKPLRFLPHEVYEKELDNVQPKPADWEQKKQDLVRKFQFAEYAFNTRDYSKSIDAFIDLENGRDNIGPLFKATSYSVANDLACAYFKKQRDKGFLASRYMTLAKDRVPANSEDTRSLEENLSTLDELVNRLD